ncbi:PRC-barrel domain-containing protein [Pseudahrensia aquimaris]|uniref:PRC-barrel domain-containing protein n=1 Tax=Pseudahrensia aquimaris TaxID=744461 RepID=A0ABW3FF65_9HYPH
MKKTFIATALATAIAAPLMATSAFTAAHTASFVPYEAKMLDDKKMVRASDLIGKYVYILPKAGYDSWDWNQIAEIKEGEWNNVGDVNDVILGRDGSIKAVVVGVGGFLGMGEKDVAVKMEAIKLLREKGNEAGFFVAMNADKATLEAAPAFKGM